MTDERVVKVTLRAQMQSYLDGMERARKATSDTATEAQRLAAQGQAFNQLGRTSLAAGSLIAVGLGVAVAKFAEFDQAMSNVQASTHETAENMASLRQAALDAGASTVFSATESANAIEELAKAGISTADILGGALNGSLDLAAAGGLGVAEAAGIAATTMQQFALSGDKAQHVADLLAAGAGKAMGDVGDLSQALKQSGLVASQFGISVEETTGALAAFAANGLLGSDAGTSFRTMLLRLANPTDEVKDLMAELGIEAYEASGQFVGLAGLAGELETSLAGMTDQQKQTTLAMIFGQDAIRASTILLKEGKDGIEEWTSAVDDQGYAAETAAARLDNLKGDIEAFQGALDTALITMGEAADGPLRSFVQGLTDVVDGFNAMPAGGQQAVFWIGAVAAAGSAGLGVWALLVPKMAEYNAALDVLGPRAQKASRVMGVLARVGGGALAGIAVGATAADLLIDAFQEAGLSGEELANKIKTATNAVQLFDAQNQKTFLGSSNIDAAALQVDKLGDALDRISSGDRGGSLVEVNALTNAQRLSKDLADLAAKDLPSAQKQFRLVAESAKLNTDQQSQLLELMEPYRAALVEQATAAGKAADDQTLLALAMGEAESTTSSNEAALRSLSGQAEDTGDAVADLSDQIRGFGSATISVKEAQAGLQQALDDLTGSIADNGATLDLNEQSGRDNQAALIDLASASKELAASLYEQTGSQEDATTAIADGRAKLIEMLGQFGITGQAAEDYADDLGLIPENIDTYVDLNTQDAQNEIDRFIYANDGRRVNLYVDGVSGRQVAGTDVIARAGGGPITGPGTGTSDSVPVMASNGEHMWTAEEVRRAGGHGVIEAWRAAVMSGASFGTGGGKSVTNNFYGQYAMTANDLMREADNAMRRGLWTAGVDA